MQKRSLTEDNIRAEIKKEAEEEMARLVEEAVEWQMKHGEYTWDELEVEVLKLRQRFGEQLARVMVKHREEARAVPGPKCPECKKEMHYKGIKKRGIVSTIGEVPLKRGYYYCSKCRRSIFPPGSSAGTEGENVESAVDADDDMAERTATL